MLEAPPVTALVGNLSDDDLEAAWKDWARKEEITRSDCWISNTRKY
jgi:hypothetical protein